MVVRRRRKKNKLRGQRTHGKGDTKHKRGAGSRGGRGRAGSHKHKYSLYYDSFGMERKKIRAKKEIKAINLDQLLQQLPKLVAEKKVGKEGNTFVIDGRKVGYGKILSRGAVKEKLIVINMGASRKAREKILAAGGKKEEVAGEKKGEIEEAAGKEAAKPAAEKKEEKAERPAKETIGEKEKLKKLRKEKNVEKGEQQ